MFAPERLKKIKQVLLEYGKVDVGNLSNLLSVSEVTVRKDLEKLESEGFLIRTHGGAVLNEDRSRSVVINNPEVPELESKKMIATIASVLIQDRDTIFLGPGTTCFEIAKSLKNKKDLIVITNNLNILIEIGNYPNCKVISTGGEVDSSEYGAMLVGELLDNIFNDIYVNKAFISVDAVSFKRGFMLRNPSFGKVCKGIKENCDELVVVADHTKFDQNAIISIGDLMLADKVISDQSAPKEYIKYFFENDVQIFTTYPLK